MNRQTSGLVVFAAGAALMVLAVIFGKFFLADLQQLGMRGYEAAHGGRRVCSCSCSLPWVSRSAPAWPWPGPCCSRRHARRAWHCLSCWRLSVWVGSALVPLIFGTHTSPTYFGTGGVLIMLLVIATAWFWGERRARLLEERARTAADLQGIGHLFFALAAWNLCGVGGMPGFALYPEKMIALGAHNFVIGQMKAVMAFFVLGWLFTALGWWRRPD